MAFTKYDALQRRLGAEAIKLFGAAAVAAALLLGSAAAQAEEWIGT